MGVANSVTSWDVSKDEINNLELSAIHEFYKRNHPKVKILGGAKKGETVVVGKDEKFVLKNATILTEEQLSKLNLTRIARFQQRTRLPTLIPLPNGFYRLNEYDVQERERRSIVYVDQSLDIPDVVEFYLDSSGSMYQGGTSRMVLMMVAVGICSAAYYMDILTRYTKPVSN